MCQRKVSAARNERNRRRQPRINDHDRKLRELEAAIRAQDQEAAINERAFAILRRIAQHYPDLDIEALGPRWFELDDDRLALQLEGGEALFELVGDRLHVAGPIGLDLEGREGEYIPAEDGKPFPLAVLRGKVACICWRPDGSHYIGGYAEDPFGAAAAALN